MSEFEILENSPTRLKIIEAFLEGNEVIEYSFVKDLVEKDTNRPDYHLNLLVENNLIRRIKGRGNYKLNEPMIQPLRNKYMKKKKVPIYLIGGLGTQLDLYTDILDALRKVSIIPKTYFLITSKEIKPQFNKTYKSFSVEITQTKPILETVDFQTVLREGYSELYKKFDEIIKKEIYNYEIICELTGSTKPVTIALMKLAEKYRLQVIYYSGQKINWI
ncbi:MAG: hypothetical protein ACFFAN_19430 [Promethearchaeota archaeon]